MAAARTALKVGMGTHQTAAAAAAVAGGRQHRDLVVDAGTGKEYAAADIESTADALHAHMQPALVEERHAEGSSHGAAALDTWHDAQDEDKHLVERHLKLGSVHAAAAAGSAILQRLHYVATCDALLHQA